MGIRRSSRVRAHARRGTKGVRGHERYVSGELKKSFNADNGKYVLWSSEPDEYGARVVARGYGGKKKILKNNDGRYWIYLHYSKRKK